MTGKLTDVMIVENMVSDQRTGLEKFSNLKIYADKGNQKVIAAVPGVMHCFNHGIEYDVYLDPRYDREYVKAEIEAAILTNGVCSDK